MHGPLGPIAPGKVAVFTLEDAPSDLILAGFHQEAGFYHLAHGAGQVALLAVPLNEGPGLKPLKMTWGAGSHVQWTNVAVGDDPYPHLRRLKVPKLRKKLKAAAAANEKEIMEGAEAEALGGVPLWRGAFRWPLDGPVTVTSPFGSSRVYNKGQAMWRHKGVDLRAAKGTPVLAANDGQVLLARRRLNATGGTVIVGHGYGLCSSYYHLSKVVVKVGDRVTKGQPLGLSGDTGLANGPHLHWQMELRGLAILPQQWVPEP